MAALGHPLKTLICPVADKAIQWFANLAGITIGPLLSQQGGC